MARASTVIPTEDEEQRVVVQYLELKRLRFSHLPMSTYTTSWKQKARNHFLGVRPGVPDLLVIIPSHRSRDGLGHLVFIELKRRSGGRVSSHQQEWIDALGALDTAHVVAQVCAGAEAALQVIEQYFDPIK